MFPLKFEHWLRHPENKRLYQNQKNFATKPDLRHTWASWHVQNGTSLHELQQLGGWCDYDTVLRYAHLSSDHLQKAASRVSGTFCHRNLVPGRRILVRSATVKKAVYSCWET